MLRFILPLLLLATPAPAQQVRNEAWLSFQSSAEIDDIIFSADVASRFTMGRLYETTIGGMIGTKIDRAEIAGGYEEAFNFDADRQVIRHEKRFRQQALITLSPRFQTRLRYEERFVQGRGGMGMRLRAQIRYAQPIGRFRILASHESFIDLNPTRWGQLPGLRRMRTYVGVELPLFEPFRLQAGYMNQYEFGIRNRRDVMGNAVALTLVSKI